VGGWHGNVRLTPNRSRTFLSSWVSRPILWHVQPATGYWRKGGCYMRMTIHLSLVLRLKTVWSHRSISQLPLVFKHKEQLHWLCPLLTDRLTPGNQYVWFWLWDLVGWCNNFQIFWHTFVTCNTATALCAETRHLQHNTMVQLRRSKLDITTGYVTCGQERTRLNRNIITHVSFITVKHISIIGIYDNTINTFVYQSRLLVLIAPGIAGTDCGN